MKKKKSPEAEKKSVREFGKLLNSLHFWKKSTVKVYLHPPPSQDMYSRPLTMLTKSFRKFAVYFFPKSSRFCHLLGLYLLHKSNLELHLSLTCLLCFTTAFGRLLLIRLIYLYITLSFHIFISFRPAFWRIRISVSWENFRAFSDCVFVKFLILCWGKLITDN